jgi:hypothetical protein
MRIRFLLTSVTAGLMGSVFALQACGSTTDDTNPTQDSGTPDVFEASVVKDTSTADVHDAAPTCDPTKNLFEGIPDASIADGGSSVGACLGCAQTHCAAQIQDCQEDCTCQGIAGDALECYAKTSSIAACLADFISVPQATQAIGIALGGCVQTSCGDECAASTFLDAGDGGDGSDQ